MASETELAFVDHAGEFYAREYGFPPIAGRLLAHLLVCQPPQQTIAELSEALLASRSAVTSAVALLAGHRAVRRFRSAGQRVDRVAIDPRALEPTGFAAAPYLEQGSLAREALALLPDNDAQRRAIVEEAAAFYDFLAERMPAILADWQARRHQIERRPQGAGAVRT